MKNKKLKCECSERGEVSPDKEIQYSDAEKSGMNHEPNECKGTNEIRTYIRDGKELNLCSCCYFPDLLS